MFQNINNNQLLNVGKIATLLSLSKAKVYKMIQTGELPGISIGRSVRVHPQDLHNYIKEKRSAEKTIK